MSFSCYIRKVLYQGRVRKFLFDLCNDMREVKHHHPNSKDKSPLPPASHSQKRTNHHPPSTSLPSSRSPSLYISLPALRTDPRTVLISQSVRESVIAAGIEPRSRSRRDSIVLYLKDFGFLLWWCSGAAVLKILPQFCRGSKKSAFDLG